MGRPRCYDGRMKEKHTISIEPEQWVMINELAEGLDRSCSWVIGKLIEHTFESMDLSHEDGRVKLKGTTPAFLSVLRP